MFVPTRDSYCNRDINIRSNLNLNWSVILFRTKQLWKPELTRFPGERYSTCLQAKTWVSRYGNSTVLPYHAD